MSESWSSRIASTYGIRLSQSLQIWFDEAWWARQGTGEFATALAPEQILHLDGEVIWPGFLPPDLLPLIGNDYGDWLCLRVGLANEVSEVVYWNHGGGDWIPFGPNLPEALLYAASKRAPATDEFSSTVWPTWAAKQLSESGKPVMPFWETGAQIDPLSALVEAGIAQTPVGRDLCLERLRRPSQETADREKAQALGVPWEPNFISWLFDSSLAPESKRDSLATKDAASGENFTQDWEGAEMEALRIERVRENLGWPMDLAGWAAERRGDVHQAIPRYWSSLAASVFSDESIRFRTLWFPEGFGKFAAARLWEHRDQLSDEQRNSPYLQLLWENDRASLRSRVSHFWLEQAEVAVNDQKWHAAFDAYLRAGWDVGMARRDDYFIVLEGLRSAAQHLGAVAMSRLISVHLGLLESHRR
jgi:hypothetical protein